jgi:hypothetical protein
MGTSTSMVGYMLSATTLKVKPSMSFGKNINGYERKN